MATSIDALPSEILSKIFKYLATSDITTNILNVSERWSDLAIHCVPWEIVVNGTLNTEEWRGKEFSLEALLKAVELGVKIDSICIKNCQDSELFDHILEIIYSKKMTIHTLILESVVFGNNTRIIDIIGRLPLLRRLEIIKNSDTTAFCNNDSPESMTELPVLSNLTDFRVTNLSVLYYTSDINWLLPVFRCCPNLKHFEMRFRQITFELMQSINSLKKLESLVFTECHIFDSNVFTPLNNNSTLKKLYMKFPNTLPTAEKAVLNPVYSMTALKSFSLDLSFHLTFGMTDFLKNLTLSIESLSLNARRTLMTDEHLTILTHRLPHLRELTLETSHTFTDTGMQQFLRKQKCLEYINFNFNTDRFYESKLNHGKLWIRELLNHPTIQSAELNLKDDLPQSNIDIIQSSKHVSNCFTRLGRFHVTFQWKRK